jgi:hypothetical protein
MICFFISVKLLLKLILEVKAVGIVKKKILKHKFMETFFIKIEERHIYFKVTCQN